VWHVDSPVPLTPRKGHTDAKKSELIKKNVHGGLAAPVLKALDADPWLASEVATRLLTAHFPASLHEDILAAVGLSVERVQTSRRPRDPRFRTRVLTAYEYRCVVCGFDVRLGPNQVALDAAHIKWHQAGGPDKEVNGLALCVLHHKTFDLGAFTIQPDLKLMVSDQVHGSTGVQEALLRFHGSAIRSPQRPEHTPKQEFLAWHGREVFKGEARHV